MKKPFKAIQHDNMPHKTMQNRIRLYMAMAIKSKETIRRHMTIQGRHIRPYKANKALQFHIVEKNFASIAIGSLYTSFLLLGTIFVPMHNFVRFRTFLEHDSTPTRKRRTTKLLFRTYERCSRSKTMVFFHL